MYVMKLKYLIAPFLLAAAALCGCQETAEIHPVAYMTDAQKTVSKSVTIDTPPAGTEISVSSSVPVNKDTKIKISLRPDLLEEYNAKYQKNYPYIVVDNEAGMEHISRGILPMMEVAILVSDCSRRGVQAAGRIAKLMKELNFKPQKTGLIVNRVPDGKLDAGTLEEIRNQGLELLGVVPHDDQVYQYDCDGKPIIRLPKDSPVRSALGEIVKKLGL